MNMKTKFFLLCLGLSCAALLPDLTAADPAAAQPPVAEITFATPEAAAQALTAAAEKFDTGAMKQILGTDGVDLVVTDDEVMDKKQSADFVAHAREKIEIVRDPKNPKVVTLSIGSDSWPMPIPLVEENGRWRFDRAAGRQEILFRRIGFNELSAIQFCLGYVEALHDYAAQKRGGSPVNQYAQHVISNPGKQDGLAWQNPDGTWGGPVGDKVAAVIAEGYTDKREPFHGYYFRILKGQGPDAPMGEMDFVVRGVMIGGFAMVAAPANYGVTGVKTFIVSHTGIVYEKDLGPDTLKEFHAMERYNPDSTWSPVQEQ